MTLSNALRAITPPDSDRELLERYVAHGEQLAFAALFQRHGPFVLGLCRRLLRDAHRAEDVFQATFLVLARKADTIRRRESVASWLHGVATRLARQVRLSESAQERRHKRAAERETSGEDNWSELVGALHEELALLPERVRVPLLLCYLEEYTQDEAATQLGVSLNTVRRRLVEGRELLRARMVKRGATLGVGLLALSRTASAATVSDSLRQAVFAKVQADAAGEALPATVAVLANGASAMVPMAKVVVWVAVLLASTVTATALHTRFSGTTPDVVARTDDPDAEPAEPFGGPLPKGAVARMGTLRFRHGSLNWTGSITFTSDGQHLVSADGWVRRWKVATGEAVTNLSDNGSFYDQVEDGRQVITADGRTARFLSWINVPLDKRIKGPQFGQAVQCREFDVESGKKRREFLIKFPPPTRGSTTPGSIAEGYTIPQYLSPDGKYHVEHRDRGPVNLWDSDGVFAHKLKPSKGNFTSHVFTPDRKAILIGDDFHQIHEFDLKTGLLQRTFGTEEENHLVNQMAISPNGRWLATSGRRMAKNRISIASFDRYLRLYDLKSGKMERTIDVPEDGGVSQLLFAPDSGTLLASLGGYRKETIGSVRSWEVVTGKAGRAWIQDPTLDGKLAVSPDGTTLATMSYDGVIRLWDRKSGKEIRPQPVSPSGLQAVCFVGDGRKMLTLGSDLAFREWDSITGKLLRTVHIPGVPSRRSNWPMFSQDGRFLHFLQVDEKLNWSIRIHETKGGKLILSHPGNSPLLSGDNKYLAYQENDNRISILDVLSGKILRTLGPSEKSEAKAWGYPIPLEFSSDGKRLVLASESLSVWDLTTGKRLSSWQASEHEAVERSGDRTRQDIQQSVTTSPTGDAVAFGMKRERRSERGEREREGELILVTTAGKLLHRIVLGYWDVECLRFSPDGKRIANGGYNKVQVWDATSGKKLHEFTGHRGRVKSLAFSPDGQRLASASEDSSLLVWDVAGK